MTHLVRVSCRQLHPRIADLAANVELSTAAVRSAVNDGADVIVLPELVTSGYSFESVYEARSVAVTSSHHVFDCWAATIRDRRPTCCVVGGFAELGDDGNIYNSAALVDAGGVRAVYRKTHLWDREKLWFRAGDTMPPVIETASGRIGIAICYDLEFPEVTRDLALRRADLLAVPTNWPLVPRPDGERPPEVVIAMASARVNRIAIACCDRAGTERGQEWTRGTTIIGSDGWPVAAAGDLDVATADLDLRAGRDKMLTDLADAFGDRRTDLYGRT